MLSCTRAAPCTLGQQLLNDYHHTCQYQPSPVWRMRQLHDVRAQLQLDAETELLA